MADPLRTAIQQVLDEYGDGWTLADYVTVMGLERLNSAGEIETAPWWYAPSEQAEWVTDGLVLALDDMRHADVEQD